MQAPLIGGMYEAQSYIANAQRCVNLIPERNPEDAPFPFTYYPTPGLVELAQGHVGPGRALWTASNGDLYAVIGQYVYYVTPQWELETVGYLEDRGIVLPLKNLRTTPVMFDDNTETAVLVDGSENGYTIDLTTRELARIDDESFYGGNNVQFLDTFLVFNRPGTQFIYSTTSNEIEPFDALYTAAKTSYSDPTKNIIVANRTIHVFGTVRGTELWFNAGNFPFPFSEIPGTFIEWALEATYGAALGSGAVFFPGRNREGGGVILRVEDNRVTRISTHAIEQTIQKYSHREDAVGFCYQQNGHLFYVINYPSANATWVWDDTTKCWHQRVWTDAQGRENRQRVQFATQAYGQVVGLDWENGKIYRLDLGVYTELGGPVVRRRSWPHLVIGFNWQGQPVSAEGKRVKYNAFKSAMQCGSNGEAQPEVWLRWSDDGGKTWGNPVPQTMGGKGNYLAQPQWQNLGISRDRVFELFWSADMSTALNGAWVDSTVLNT